MRPYLQCFDISIYGADQAVHDKLTKRLGSYASTMKALHLLVEAKMPVFPKYITMQDNFHQINKFMEDMKQLGVPHAVSTGSLIPRTNRDSAPLVQILTDEQYQQLLDTRPMEGLSDPGHCKPGHVRGAITPSGFVSPCEWLTDFKLGNVRTEPLRDIWYSREFLQFRKIFEEESECPSCSLRPGCGRCPAMSYLETGDLLKCAPVPRHQAELYQQFRVASV
jgi:radical SAM protein with 4Fe4S-binding SPASM domain